MRRLTEIQTKQQNFLKKNEDIAYQRERIEKELNDQQSKLERAEATKNQNYDALVQAVEDFKDSAKEKDVQFEAESLKTKYIMNAISILISEIPELQGVLEQPLQEIGLEIPQLSERPATGSSQRSGASRRSGASQRSGRSGNN